MTAGLTAFRALGRSGLVVSPAALGTMTFGRQGWGSTDEVSRAVFDAYVDAGGNFIDTAEIYSGGRSEEMVGAYVADRKLREQMVLATKFGWNAAGHPNSAGVGRKNIYRALEGSLNRLRTDYVDLYWMHVWDMVTPAEDVLQTFGDLQRAGKIRHFGLSNVPAWYAVRMATLAQAHGVPGPIALQLEYSLVARTVEREHVPAARECGMSIVPWSPLAGGFLSAKYVREEASVKGKGEGRLSGPNPFQGPATKFTEANWRVLDALQGVAKEVGRPAAQVALAWTATQPGVASLLLGASSPEQLIGNVAALQLQLSAEQLQVLGTASMLEPNFFTPQMNQMIFGGTGVLSSL
jgi:aryl-alcohol dehydrogenase-like predicted oxidoreductase